MMPTTRCARSCDVNIAYQDRTWSDLLERHNAVVRSELSRWRGHDVNPMGDGFLATLDGPARAIHCASSITEAMAPLGIEVRCGLHAGEVELVGDDVAGVAVHIAARIAALAGPSEVVVSRTVKDLVAGSGFAFRSRGEQALKGIPDHWEIFEVASSQPTRPSQPQEAQHLRSDMLLLDR